MTGWQDIEAEVLRRIRARHWPPGELIPSEADLAEEFGVARATVNRALRSVADAGLLDRRRKAGTRVALRPVRRATVSIPIIRAEIEARGQAHGYLLLRRTLSVPPSDVRAALGLSAARILRLEALHTADGAPFVLEARWINSEALPEALDADFKAISANEWLVMHAPVTHGEITLQALPADAEVAGHLGCAPGAALFALDRRTWDGETGITAARLVYAPGYRMQMGV